MIFVNRNGVLCKTVRLFGKDVFTLIDVSPVFDGYDVGGNVICEDDWMWAN